MDRGRELASTHSRVILGYIMSLDISNPPDRVKALGTGTQTLILFGIICPLGIIVTKAKDNNIQL